jgi:hydrogenase/urease accessory protein HupE
MRRLLLLMLLLVPPCAWGHATQLSASRIELKDGAARIRLELNVRDLDAALRIVLTGADGQASPGALARAQPAIAEYALAHARVLGPGGGACRGETLSVEPKAEHVVVSARWTCPPAAGLLRYHVTLFQEIDPAAKHIVIVEGDVRRMGLLSTANPRFDLLEIRASRWEVARHYVLAGIEHIVIGYDHIAFLVAVILWGRRPGPLVGVVTAFTVAHSITLSAAVLGLFSPPSRLVEALIALSIVYVAAENFFVRDIRRRWRVTFVFGLAHGFGFASVLRDYGLPRDALVPALAAFNVGVEIGQVAIVLLALGAMRVIEALSRMRARGPVTFPEPRFVHALSWAILALGLYWTVERVLG